MALFASDRGIMTGEELTYDYNFDPYSQKNVQVCRCGAENCRGVLGPKPKELPKKEKESALAGAKRKIAEVIEEGKEMMTGNKKRKVEEKKKLPKGWVYLPAEEKPKSKSTKAKTKSETGSENEQGTKNKDDDAINGSLSRRPSKLRRMVSTKSSKTGRSIKSVSSIGRKGKTKVGKRIISTNSTSSGTALIAKKPVDVDADVDVEGKNEDKKENETEEWEDAVEEVTAAVTVERSESKRSKGSMSSVTALKAKAGSIKGRVGRSLRGR